MKKSWFDRKPYYDARETAHILGVSRSTVYRWIEEGTIKRRVCVLDRWYFARTDVLAVKKKIQSKKNRRVKSNEE